MKSKFIAKVIEIEVSVFKHSELNVEKQNTLRSRKIIPFYILKQNISE